MKMEIKEFIEKLNNYCEEEYIYDIDDIDNFMVQLRYVDTLQRDEHRWYVLAENVYKVELNEQEYFLGVWEVETVKSEAMSVSDCDVILEFYEMERFSTVTYSYKKKD